MEDISKITRKIIVQTQDRVRIISANEIAYCKSDNCYTFINLANGDSVLICKSLTKFSLQLDPAIFARVSQSYLVNTLFIRSIDKRNKQIELENSVVIPFTTSVKQLLDSIIYEQRLAS